MGPFHQADHVNWRRAPVPLGLAGGVVGEEEPAVIIERRAIMLSRGGRLGTFAFQALGEGRSLSCLESPADLEDWAHPPVDVVLLDYPRRHRGIVYRQLRQRYRGPVLALLDPGDDGGGLPADRGPLAVLHRPFSGEELTEVLGSLLPAGDPATVGAFEPAIPLRIVAELASLPPPAGSAQAVPPQLLVSTLTFERAEPSLRESRWDALMRRGLRRWQVLVGATAIVLFGLAFAAPDPCTSGCANLAGGAGGAERNALAAVAGSATAGVGSSPRAGAGGSAASSTASTIIPGVPPPATIPTLGGLLSGLGGGGTTSPLLIAPVGGPAPLPAPAPAATTTTTPAATTTTKPTATTKPPTTTTKPPAPTTTAAPPPTPTTAPPSPTTEPPPPTTDTTTTTEPPPDPTTTTAPA